MYSGLLKRSERYRFVGVLLRVRAVVYLVAGFLVSIAPGSPAPARMVSAVLIVSAAGAPFIVRRNNRYAGVRLSAAIDLAASFVLWLTIPWAGGLSLLLSIWALAILVFLSPAKSASRITLVAIVLELSKIAAVLLGAATSDPASPSEATDIGILLVRTLILGGAYLLFRAVDHYVRQVAAAAETGSERYRRLMDAAPTAFLVEVDSEIVYANDAAADLLERPIEILVGSNFAEMIAEDDRDRFAGSVHSASDRLGPATFESIRVHVGESEERWVDATCTLIDHGRDLAVQIALNDRSGQRKAEFDLRRTAGDYREFFERIPVALYRSLPDGTITRANNALVELFGAESEADVIGFDARDLYVDHADREHLGLMLEDTDVVVGFEARMYRVDGQMIWVRDTSRRIVTDDGVVYEGAMVDITSRRSIENELWSRAAQQEAAATIGQIALDSDDISTALGEITDRVSRVLDSDGVVLLQRQSEDKFELTGADTGFALTPEAVLMVADRAHMTAAPVVLRSEAEIRFAAPKLADIGVRSCVAVMIPGVDSDFGTLIVVARDDRLFTADDINFLLAVANVLAAAIDRSIAKTRLEDLLRSKDAFVASVSHELRTPLTVVTGMAHELNERWMHLSDEELGEFTAMLVEQSRDMSDLIEDLLVAARSNIGNVTVRHEHVSLEREIESVIAGFVDAGSSSIAVRTSSELVVADPIRVRQILRNLITNALRYGGPTIEVVTSPGPGSLAVEVIDDGAGIPSEDHERIFVAYERAHHVEGQPGSVGLGLTVSRTLAELMGGSLTYRFDGRSVFRLELPRVAEDSGYGRPAARMTGDDITRGMRTIGAGRIGVDVSAIE